MKKRGPIVKHCMTSVEYTIIKLYLQDKQVKAGLYNIRVFAGNAVSSICSTAAGSDVVRTVN